ncbi:MAG TPA: hypothetical protein DEF35_05320 [Paenibacillus sp.]|nr:hypothetical protein P364_0124145 [Paenibacillus sp. MAEPY2]KGP87928.1 hypothetical protein P363_0109800 [Paenibacillus sp. MAEPY1]OZQ64795.1 hypothetical protein CA599_21665 [Paenibacillus taichungensis]HBU81044.1 hypothetical protein [Paenibacillus sp.]
MNMPVNHKLKRFDIFIIVGVDSDFNLFIYFSQKYVKGMIRGSLLHLCGIILHISPILYKEFVML